MAAGTPALNLSAVIGFGGKVVDGLKAHPDGVHIVYPLGSTVVIANTATQSQAFLQGHTDKVTCICMSKDGRYIASGQRTEMGSKATIILWDFAAGVRSMGSTDGTAAVHKLVLHKVSVQALDFSSDNAYLASIGGQDDNSLVVWDVAAGKAVCGSAAGNHAALTVKFFNGRSDRLVTGGQYHLRAWDFNVERRRLSPEDWKTGSIKRIFTCVTLDDTDARAYAGTSTGDLLEFNTSTGNFVQSSKHKFSLGILCAAFVPRGGPVPEDSVLVGTGDGALLRLAARDLDVKKAAELLGGVSSISMSADGASLYAGTETGNVYTAATAGLETKLRSTAHKDAIADVIFPEGTSALFITASGSDIRVWNTAKRAELLRVQVPNLACNCIAINAAGTCIVSGWDDGKIRAFLPESGKLLYAITDAHAESVTAIAFAHDGSRVISGGKDGRVRVWSVAGKAQTMEYSFKEHKKEVTSIRVSASDEECVSASADGSCLIWNLKRGTRTAAMFASTVFRAVAYHPDESQLLTAGSDRKITYWDAADCNAIRVMEGSTEEIMSVDVEREGVAFVSGGLDRLVKLWLYDEGELIGVGTGHSGAINKVAISSDKKHIVSVGAEGAVFVWDVPDLPAPSAPVVPVSHTLKSTATSSRRG